ncbi:hypothetical protein ACTMSW_08750 [Micromonospora sp. BQ11]|uniref:hypothetical protein n=1 Tax=Micromonospora sp. BQ11 TaxID=3452212 RepID=UPI003F8B5C2A
MSTRRFATALAGGTLAALALVATAATPAMADRYRNLDCTEPSARTASCTIAFGDQAYAPLANGSPQGYIAAFDDEVYIADCVVDVFGYCHPGTNEISHTGLSSAHYNVVNAPVATLPTIIVDDKIEAKSAVNGTVQIDAFGLQAGFILDNGVLTRKVTSRPSTRSMRLPFTFEYVAGALASKIVRNTTATFQAPGTEGGVPVGARGEIPLRMPV